MLYAGHKESILCGLVAEPAGWSHSQFKACVARGGYPPEWVGERVSGMQAGEPGG